MTESEVQYATEFYLDLTEKTQVKILHVDDEPDVLKVAKQCLEMQDNFQVDSAISVEEAEKKMQKRCYDVIVSDYVMPDRNGLEFLSDLRRTGNLIPFIIFTGKGRKEVAVRALNLGADQYVNKIGDPETVYLELTYGIRKAVERRRADKRIKESEEKFRNIFESANDAMIYLDMKGRILDINKKTMDIYGGEKSELIGKHFTKLGMLSPKDVPRLMKAFSRGLSGKHPLLNITIRDWKGQPVSLECQGSMTITSHGNTLLVIARDVTKRKTAEEGMKKSEEKYRALLEETPIGICNINMRGRITYVNAAFESILGYSRNGVLGRSVFTLARQAIVLSDKQLKPIITRIRGRLAGRKKSQPMTITLKRKDGSLRWVEAESKLIKKFGIPVGLQAIIRDITERKITREKMKESEERFRSIVENSHGGIGIVDDSFKIKYINERACVILGYSKKEILKQDFRKFLHKDYQSLILDRYLRRQRGENIPPKYEFDVIRKDGEKITVEMKATILKDVQGRIQTLAEILDITERKNSIEKIKKMNEKLNVVGRFVRHDVQNNLTVIKGNAFLIKKEKVDGQILKYLEEIESSVRQIERIFDFSKAYEQIGVEKLAYIDVARIIENAVSPFSGISQIKIINDCQGLMVLADSLFRQIFYNLVDNSLKHGEKVSKIRFHYDDDGNHLKLIYEDDGIGIVKSEKERIFDEGYGKGTGYGLYLIKKICEVYRWTIREVGKYGERFQLIIGIPKSSNLGRDNYRF